MKNKLLFRIIVFLAIIVLLSGVILFSGKIQKTLKNNKKQAIGENSITTVDVTGIELGKEIEHEHVYKIMYDEKNHWEECIVCGEKQNNINHNLETTWASGYESCYYNNPYTKTCSCGYSETGYKSCVWSGSYYKDPGYWHIKQCAICGGGIYHSYYLNTYGIGEVYLADCDQETAIPGEPWHQFCYKADGTRLTCDNLGKCDICKRTISYKQHNILADTNTNRIYCQVCNSEFGTFSVETDVDLNEPLTYTNNLKFNFTNGATFNRKGKVEDNGAPYQIKEQTITIIDDTRTQVILTNTVRFKYTWKERYNFRASCYIIIDGVECFLRTSGNIQSPDLEKPIILSIAMKDEDELTKWSKNKPITISGTENWTNTVKIKILDDENNEVFSGETTVNNGNYSISCTPDVEAGVEGRTFKAVVTDACENSTEQEFTISKIDSIPPEATSNAEVGGDWAKEKSFTAVASDHGIGNVQIAFNDVSDYQLATANGTEYTREYKLVGDVYSPTKARVFYKDELNNISSQEITIDKIDNTAPTIIGSRFDNNKLIIEANDIKEGMGEGSGVAKYRFITSNTQYENPVVSNADSTEINVGEDMIIPNIANVKYVYVVAEDNVGNVSEVYEVEVPHLDLRTEVNLSAANGKGGVDLDWTGYDPSNKVFKAYQKKEGAEEFESISTVDFYKEIEPIKVLNIYPEYKGDTYGDIPTVTFRYLDETSVSLPKSAALKVWMEGGTMTEGSKTTNFEAYGRNPITGQQIIKVDLVGVSEFNTNPKVLRDYDVVVFGTWNGNGGINNLVNDAAIEEVEKYIKDGYGILTGHDSIGLYYYGTGLSKLRKYFNIEVGIFENPPKDLSLIDQNVGWYYFSTKIKVDKVGLITNFPYVLPENAILTIPSTHTMSNAAKGNVWITLVNGTDYGNSKYSIKNYKGKGNPVYYLTTWNNTAMIQTGNSNCESTADERKVLANTLFYLKQRTTETAFTDNSAQDLKAPNAPSVSAVREGSKIKLAHNADDNGSEYKYYVEAYDIADQSILLSKSNERTEVVTTGTKGYYYIIDDNSENIDFDIKDATYVEGDSSLINLSNNGKYIHMKAVDVAGNVSEETTIKLEVEIPELRLTSKVNLNGANGKGTVELDWSTFELEDMYYVVYRKEKSDTEWTKIVSIEDKLTVKKYIDNLGNDKTKPSMPTINITGNSAGNSIDISAAATDTGTNYVYYVECYDTITNKLIISSKNN